LLAVDRRDKRRSEAPEGERPPLEDAPHPMVRRLVRAFRRFASLLFEANFLTA
jgi:hypothetical protein